LVEGDFLAGLVERKSIGEHDQPTAFVVNVGNSGMAGNFTGRRDWFPDFEVLLAVEEHHRAEIREELSEREAALIRSQRSNDPAIGYNGGDWAVEAITNDGLLAYRHDAEDKRAQHRVRRYPDHA
jgi:hypothetical protein